MSVTREDFEARARAAFEQNNSTFGRRVKTAWRNTTARFAHAAQSPEGQGVIACTKIGVGAGIVVATMDLTLRAYSKLVG